MPNACNSVANINWQISNISLRSFFCGSSHLLYGVLTDLHPPLLKCLLSCTDPDFSNLLTIRKICCLLSCSPQRIVLSSFLSQSMGTVFRSTVLKQKSHVPLTNSSCMKFSLINLMQFWDMIMHKKAHISPKFSAEHGLFFYESTFYLSYSLQLLVNSCLLTWFWNGIKYSETPRIDILSQIVPYNICTRLAFYLWYVFYYVGCN